jgi:hypothetical protein
MRESLAYKDDDCSVKQKINKIKQGTCVPLSVGAISIELDITSGILDMLRHATCRYQPD